MSAPLPAGSSHLLVADDALSDGHRSGTYVAACGDLVSVLEPSRPSARDRLYCEKCVAAAVRWSPAGASP